MASPFRVRVFRGEQLIDERIFSDTLVKLGRHSSAHVPLDDRGASFVHAVLTVDGEELALTDVSGRGTFINGRSVGKKVLAPGDEIRIAGLRVLVDLPPFAAAAPVPVPEPELPGAVPLLPQPPAVVAEPEPPAAVAAPAAEPQAARPVEPPRPRGALAPHEPGPPRPLRPHERPALQLSCYWGDQLLQVLQHREPRRVLMGPTPRCEVKAGSRERPLIEPLEDGFGLNVEVGMRAHLRRGEKVQELGPGVHVLEPTDLAWVEAGNLRVEASFAAAPQRVRVPVAQAVDFRLVNLVLALSFVAAAFAISAQFHQTEDLIADDLSLDGKLFVQVMEPLRRTRLRTDALAALETSEPAAPAARHSGSEGQAGDKTVKHKRPAIGALGDVRIDTKNLVSRSGLLAGLNGPSVANMLGTGGFKSDVVAALGNLTGPHFGSAGGLGGLGLRGGGSGAGGTARTYGIGNINTPGRATGNDLYGRGQRLKAEKKDRSIIKIDDTPPETSGSLDPELIRRVIRSHVDQIRFCYEQRLVSQPSLAGKVRVRFLVNGEGRVEQASIAEGTTLHDRQLSACLLSRFRSWIFPAPKGGGSALVTYPVWLRPTGE